MNARNRGTPIPPEEEQREIIAAKASERFAAYMAQRANPRVPTGDTWDALRERLTSDYEQHADFDSPAARGQLASIVNLEVEQAKLSARLSESKISDKARDGLLDQMRRMAATHRDLLVSAGLDRKASEQSKREQSPMEKWDEQKLRIFKFMQDRKARLPQEAAAVETERDLRELIRYLTRLGLRHH